MFTNPMAIFTLNGNCVGTSFPLFPTSYYYIIIGVYQPVNDTVLAVKICCIIIYIVLGKSTIPDCPVCWTFLSPTTPVLSLAPTAAEMEEEGRTVGGWVREQATHTAAQP